MQEEVITGITEETAEDNLSVGHADSTMGGGESGNASSSNESLDAEAVRGYADQALLAYLDAHLAGDSQKVAAIQQAVAQNEQTAALFAQRIEQLRNNERIVLSQLKKDISDLVVAKLGYVLNNVLQYPITSYQAIRPRDIQDFEQYISVLSRATQGATSVYGLASVLRANEATLAGWYRHTNGVAHKLADINGGWPPESVAAQVQGIRSALEALIKIKDQTGVFLTKMRIGDYSR